MLIKPKGKERDRQMEWIGEWMFFLNIKRTVGFIYTDIKQLI